MPGISVVPGSLRKICQLTGEHDRQRGTHAYNRTETRFGLVGTDLGASFEHGGRLWLLFGDTWPDPDGGDSVAWTTDRSPEPGIRLHFATSGSRFASPRVATPDGRRVSTGFFEVPTAGFSANGHLYVVRTTDHRHEGGREVMGRSVLTRAVGGDPTDLVCLYDLSVVASGGRFVNVSCVVVDGGLPGLPFRGPALVAWGSGRYRASDAYLAAVPLGSVEDGDAWRYFCRHRRLRAARLERARARRRRAVPASGDRRAVGHLERAPGPVAAAVQLRNAARHRRAHRRRPVGPLVGACGRPRSGPRRLRRFIHVKDAPDGLADPGREHEWGGEYGPYVVGRYTRALPGGRTAVYFVLSTWNPYQVVEMGVALRPE